MPEKKDAWKGWLLAGFAASSWGASAVVGRALYGHSLDSFDPMALNFYRFLLGTIVLNGFLLFTGKWQVVREALRRDWKTLILAGLFGVTLEGSFQLWSLAYTTAGRSTLFGSSSPIFTLIFSVLLLRERAGWCRYLGAFTGFAGMVILFFCNGGDLFASERQWIGDILATCSSVSWAFYTIVNAKVVQKYGGLVCTCIMMPVGTLFLLPIVAYRHAFMLQLTPSSAVGIAYLGIIACGVSYVCWAQAGKYLPTSVLGSFGYFNLLVGLLLAVLFLDEQFGLWQCVSAAVIVAGTWLMMRTQKSA